MGTWVWDYETQREVWRDDCLADGESLRVPLMLCDSAQKDVRDHYVRDQFVRDQLATHNACAGHKAGFGIDTLKYSSRPVPTVDAVSNDLVERRGTGLRDAMIDGEMAYADTMQRQQWKTTIDAATRLKKAPEDDEENNGDNGEDESNGDESNHRELGGSAEYPGGDYTYTESNGDDDSGDDNVFTRPRAYKQQGQYGSEELGHGSSDSSGIRAAEDDAERAYRERTQRGDQLWRTGPAVNPATRIQQELDRTRGK